MFNLQGSELMIILLLALVVLGPEKLPEAMRKLGKMYGELKRMSTGFQEEFRSAVDEPLREFRKAVDEPMSEIRGTAAALRDSADFRRFEAGERTEKPKSGDMATLTEPAAMLSPADADAVPVAATPSFDSADEYDPHPDDHSHEESSADDIPSVTTNPEKPPSDNVPAVGNDVADDDAAVDKAADNSQDAADDQANDQVDDNAPPSLQREKPGPSE